MLEYRGKYRVSFEMDKKCKPCEFSFMPCAIKKGSNICRHNADILNIYVPSGIVIKNLLKAYPQLFKKFQHGDYDGTLLFAESDMPTVAKILKARTKGANVSPRAKRNATFIQKVGVTIKKTG